MKYNIKSPLGEILGQCEDVPDTECVRINDYIVTKRELRALTLTLEPIKKLEAWSINLNGDIRLFTSKGSADIFNGTLEGYHRIVHLVEVDEQ